MNLILNNDFSELSPLSEYKKRKTKIRIKTEVGQNA